MKASLLSSIFLFLFGCKQHSSVFNKLSFKDSVVKEYLAAIDSLEFHDTLNRDFKILRAYFINDTAFFSSMRQDMYQSRRDAIFYGRDDSCVVQTRLSDLNVERAYRFKHWQAFCPFRQNITLTLDGNKVMLHYIEYSNGDGDAYTLVNPKGDTLQIKPYCSVIKEFDKSLSMHDWEEFEKEVREADYWGMKEKGGGGLDGSIWQIDAFVNEKFKSFNRKSNHSVWRHSVFSRCFEELGRYMVKLCGEKTMCGDIF